MINRKTRRDLLVLTGASLVSPALFARPQENPSTEAPDLVVFNARVIRAYRKPIWLIHSL